ncbi:MAG: hypothetical protein ABR543_10790 [Gemmatimonadaceae bacterium]
MYSNDRFEDRLDREGTRVAIGRARAGRYLRDLRAGSRARLNLCDHGV